MENLRREGSTLVLIRCDETSEKRIHEIARVTTEIVEGMFLNFGIEVPVDAQLLPMKQGFIAVSVGVLPHQRKEFKWLWDYVKSLTGRFGECQIWMLRRLF